MKFALSTNWCNRTLETGEAIVEKALELGFDALELGFHTTDFQVAGFRRRRNELPIGSVHAFCPVPISAPQGYPELYSLASFDEEDRKMAHFQIVKNIRFAAEMGADALVLHLGRVLCHGWFARRDCVRRLKRGRKMLEIARRELDALVPELEKNGVRLGLENLPYVEGFPNETELPNLAGDWVRPWFDTGHGYVRLTKGWTATMTPFESPLGLHLNDSNGGDDHLAPGQGKIDFAALKDVAARAEHLVLEPHAGVTDGELKAGLSLLRTLWASDRKEK